jgi:dolichol-phosphate mannosyltransferase
MRRLGKFLLVGATGLALNTVVLVFLFQGLHLPLVVASALAVECAIANNFWWNDRWTFARRRPSVGRFVRFNLVSLAGLTLTTATAWLLVQEVGLHYLLANLAGVGLATLANFVANAAWTWR